ncbi:MAG: hypothetical protein ACLVAS_11815 [Mediterraneibacter gnavus]
MIKKRIAKAQNTSGPALLSPQCGFASCEIGNKLTEEEQWAKLALVKEIAKEVWGKKIFFFYQKQFLPARENRDIHNGCLCQIHTTSFLSLALP